jgi:hypothetical protein
MAKRGFGGATMDNCAGVMDSTEINVTCQLYRMNVLIAPDRPA